MNELIPSNEISEIVSLLKIIIPITYGIFVFMATIALNVVDFNGVIANKYIWKQISICIVLGVLGYLFYPEFNITDIPKMFLGMIASVFAIRVFATIRQNKIKKK